ncbi:MAG TPA: hypothetical protein V6D15_13390 [Oculatellaceae cyanobacterium]
MNQSVTAMLFATPPSLALKRKLIIQNPPPQTRKRFPAYRDIERSLYQ